MTVLEVSHVYLDGVTAWCQVLCRQGALRVGDRLTGLRSPGQPPVAVGLTVEQIETTTGLRMHLETYALGRIRVTGDGVAALRDGCILDNPGQWQQVPTPQPAWQQLAVRPLAESDRPALSVDEPAHLDRSSTAFRWVLFVPHYIVLYALSIAAFFVLVIGWFGALFTGRLPLWAVEYLEGFVRYQTRVYGYVFLLTDKFPPFGFAQSGYPIRVELPPAGKLNRWSVFFRGILAIPVSIVAGMAMLGWFVASFVIWLIVLIGGRFPSPLFGASVALLRFNLRTSAYFYLLTSRYPRGLFGDTLPEGATDGNDPASGQFALTLTRGAKRIVVLFLVLGVLGYGGYGVLLTVVGTHSFSRQLASIEVRVAHIPVSDAEDTFHTQIAQCSGASDQLICVQQADSQLASTLRNFDLELDRISEPRGTQEFFARLDRSTQLLAQALEELSAAPTSEGYSALVQRDALSQRRVAFDTYYDQLITELGN